jgi:hypothetical protein
VSLFRRQRNWSDIISDPHAPYMIGRLLGANEMAAILLRLEDNQTAQQIAEALTVLTGYFMEGTKAKPFGVSESEQVTQVIKPQK